MYIEIDQSSTISGTDMYAADGKWLMLFGVETATAYRKSVFASKLMKTVIEDTKNRDAGG